MPWEPENFAPAERKAAGSAVVQAQVVVYKLRVNASEFGAEHAAAVTGAYLRVGTCSTCSTTTSTGWTELDL